jgi:hypothetical protein
MLLRKAAGLGGSKSSYPLAEPTRFASMMGTDSAFVCCSTFSMPPSHAALFRSAAHGASCKVLPKIAPTLRRSHTHVAPNRWGCAIV